MLYQPAIYCYTCCKETVHINGECDICANKKRELAHKTHFAKLDCLTLEERVRRLERIEYNHSINPPWREPRY